MNSLDPLATAHNGTRAFRAISFVIQAEAYIVPDLQPMHLNLVRADGAFIWSAKMAAAPLETVATHCLNLDKVGLGAVDRDTSNRLYRNSQRTWQSPSQGDARLLMHSDLRPRLSAATGFDEATLDVLQAQARALKEWLAAEGYTQIKYEVPILQRETSRQRINGIIDLPGMDDGKRRIFDHKSRAGCFAGCLAQLNTHRGVLSEEGQAIKPLVPSQWIDWVELKFSSAMNADEQRESAAVCVLLYHPRSSSLLENRRAKP